MLFRSTTSATMPMVAVGNVPLTGSNPPRYLESEFNYLEVENENGECIRVYNGAHIRGKQIRLRANVGNIQHACWLKPEGDSFGGVWQTVTGKDKFSAPITADTPYLADAVTEWVTLTVSGEYVLQMEAKGIGAFGDKWRITLE